MQCKNIMCVVCARAAQSRRLIQFKVCRREQQPHITPRTLTYEHTHTTRVEESATRTHQNVCVHMCCTHIHTEPFDICTRSEVREVQKSSCTCAHSAAPPVARSLSHSHAHMQSTQVNTHTHADNTRLLRGATQCVEVDCECVCVSAVFAAPSNVGRSDYFILRFVACCKVCRKIHHTGRQLRLNNIKRVKSNTIGVFIVSYPK